MLRRQKERERVVMESIQDGFEEDLLPEEDAIKIMRRVQQEKKRREFMEMESQRHHIVGNNSSIIVDKTRSKYYIENIMNHISDGVSLSALDTPSFDRGQLSIRPAEEIIFYFVISKPWLDAWKVFVLAGDFEDIEYPQPPPGPINNFDLLNPGTHNEIRADLVIDQDYCVVSPGVWNVLHDIYGGGPVLQRENINIYSSHRGSKVGTIIC